MIAGFGWQHAPFQICDAIGLDAAIAIMKAEGQQPAQLLQQMQESCCTSFYSVIQVSTYYYDIASKTQLNVPV